MTPPRLTETDAPPWWRGAVIYQIYPRSYQDSNGDGVGDLPGIIRRLDHVASLGIDAIWLSPFFASPMADFGYDVSDYRDVDPLFGSLDDFDRLVAAAHDRGLKVVIDQVYSHTSDQHDWFRTSHQSRDNPKADWYVWADPKPDGAPPSNWQSVLGGPAWAWDNRRRQYYLHNFLVEQPDLNLHNPAVQDALLDVAKFWLDRGVDGFRLDAINFAMHDPHLRDNPARTDFERPPTRPFDFQEHRFNISHPDVPRFLERLRALMDGYADRFTVAEIGGPNALGEMKAFTEGAHRLNTAYGFDFLYADRLTPALVRKCNEDWPGAPGEGWPSWAFSNHDAPRHVSRWAGDIPHAVYAKTTLLLLMAMRGNAFVYQGEELGLVQGEVPFEKLQDPEAIANWPETLGRDGARTPMVWAADAPQAGFSDAPEIWLPIDPRHIPDAVDRQEADREAVLHFARAAIALRKETPALRLGDIRFLDDAPAGLLAFTRSHGDQTALCVFNLSADPITWTPGAAFADRRIALSSAGTVSGETPPDAVAAGTGYIAL